MHLIQGKLSGKDIPTALPPTLVPPSMRSNGPTSPFAAVPHSQQTEAIRDLLWDDSPPTSTVNTQPYPSALLPQATGIASPAISPPPVSRAPQAPQDPFSAPPRNCTFLRFLSHRVPDSRSGVQLQHSTKIFSVMMMTHTRLRPYTTTLRRSGTSRTTSTPRISLCKVPRQNGKHWKPHSLAKRLSCLLCKHNLLLQKLPLRRRQIC